MLGAALRSHATATTRPGAHTRQRWPDRAHRL